MNDKEEGTNGADGGGAVTLFLCGDVMTGRGIDQILPHPCPPGIYEPFARSAEDYVRLAEETSGPIPRPVDFSHVWGDALDELKRMNPDVRIINLETAVTKSEDHEGKGINYRMHPENIAVLTLAGVDCCSLANNHVLDWGVNGLLETIITLRSAGIKPTGAGQNIAEAETPAVLNVGGKGRVIVFSFGDASSGIPFRWCATETRPGVNMLRDLSQKTAEEVRTKVCAVKKPGDIVVFSVHWGGNWGYDVLREQRDFGHRLIDSAGVDIIHGHSSHHVKGIEVYRGKLILHGCGDFINDYEGIGGYEYYRGDLGLMYFVSADSRNGELLSLRMTPTRIRRLRVTKAGTGDAHRLREILKREGGKFGTDVELAEDFILSLKW